MNLPSARIWFAILVAGAPLLLAGLVANLAVLPGVGSGSQTAPPQVVSPTGVAFVQALLAPASDPRVLIAAGVAMALGFAYLVWRKRNKEVESEISSPISYLLGFIAFFLIIFGLSLFAKPGQGSQPVLPIIVSQWATSAGNFTSTTSGSYAVFALLALATLGILLFASMRTAGRAASKTLRTEMQAEPPSEEAAPGREARRPEFGSGPRGTVLKCYWGITDALQKRANLDASWLTAREFESLVGSGLTSTKTFLHEATTLFEKAKYSDYPITQEEANRSMVCLENLAPGREGNGLAAARDSR